MLFRIRGQRFALEVNFLAEISDLLPACPVPGAPPFLRGVANIHGRGAAVLDLALFLGLGPTDHGRNLLLVNSPDSSLAFVVEQMERMIGGDDIGATQRGSSSLLPLELILADGCVPLLDVAALLDAVEQALVAPQ
jgi:purine-binding chemotaxis protein CheW